MRDVVRKVLQQLEVERLTQSELVKRVAPLYSKGSMGHGHIIHAGDN